MSIQRRTMAALAGALIYASATLPGLAKETITLAATTFAEAGRGDRLKAWVQTFNGSQDQVEVQPISIPFASFASTIFTQLGGGQGPDLIRFDLQDYYAAVDAGLFMPMDAMVDEAKHRMVPADAFLKKAGKRYGVIFENTGYALLYNPALVPGGKAPGTFEAFISAAKAATANGAFGFAFRASLAERPGFWQDVCNFVFGFGGRWTDEAGKPTLNSARVVEGIRAYQRMYDAGATPKGADAATYRRMFWEGKLAMEIDNGGVATIFVQQAPSLALASAPSPFPTRTQGMIVAPLSVNAKTVHGPAVKTFLDWMLRPENQAALRGVLGAPTFVATVVPRDPADLAKFPWLATYDEQAQYGIPQLPQGQEVRTPDFQQVVLEQVLKVLQGGLEAQKAMDEAQSRIERALRR